MSPKAKHDLARDHLERALPAVTSEDYTEAVTWLFAALEAAVVSLAERYGRDTQRLHWKKAEAAQEMYSEGLLSHDFSRTLAILNRARKVAIYEGDEPDLSPYSLEDVASDVTAAVELAEREAAA